MTCQFLRIITQNVNVNTRIDGKIYLYTYVQFTSFWVGHFIDTLWRLDEYPVALIFYFNFISCNLMANSKISLENFFVHKFNAKRSISSFAAPVMLPCEMATSKTVTSSFITVQYQYIDKLKIYFKYTPAGRSSQCWRMN